MICSTKERFQDVNLILVEQKNKAKQKTKKMSFLQKLAKTIKQSGCEDNLTEFNLCRRRADKGSKFDQYQTGLAYYYGLYQDEKIKQDMFLAAWYLKKASYQGVVLADNKLALVYYYGKGVEQNLYLAWRFARKAAQEGFLDGTLVLALMYFRGQIVPRDIGKSKELLKDYQDNENVRLFLESLDIFKLLD